MIQARAWPVRVMYMLIAAALAISLLITAAPAQKVSGDCTADVCAEWEMVNTPTMDDFVLAPASTIIDYHTASAGEEAYAIVVAYDEDCSDSSFTDMDFRLLKSDDYAATWSDITDALEDVIDVDDGDFIYMIWRVATDWEDPDFVAVALVWWDDSANSGTGAYFLHVFFSTDGGTTFEDADEVEDGGVYFNSGMPNWGIADLVVSPEAGGKRDIFIGGQDDSGNAALFRCTVTGDSAAAWEDVTDTGDYEGWDNQWPPYADPTDDIDSELVTDIAISSSWTSDKTVLVTTVSNSTDPYYGVYLQCGSMGTSPGWNAKSSLGIDAVEVKTDDSHDVLLPMDLAAWDARGIAGLVLPEDYNSKNSDETLLWAWVNYWEYTSEDPMCDIMRVEEDSADLVGPMGQIDDGELWITNISYHGTIAEGEAIAGVLGDGGMDYNSGSPDLTELFMPCCDGVQVYRNNGIRNMDICCERWHDACKPPTGVGAMAVTYVGDDKAYAVALMGVLPFEEGAWSVTFDDGDSWNQLSLIDTYIDYISDVAVSPDCNKTFLATVFEYTWSSLGDPCGCDSVWLHAEDLPEAEEYSGQWLRTWCGLLEGDNSNDFPYVTERSLLRLAPEETTGDTVFLVDRMSGNVYWNDMETLACWDSIASTAVVHIVDLVAQDAETLFALDLSGEVSMFDDDEWQEKVDSELDAGWCIAVWDNQVLVGGQDGDVSYSADFDPEDEDTFTELEKVYDHDKVYVNVAFDSYFDQNDTIYAALAHAYDDNGIYLLVIDGEKEEWTKLAAKDYDYTGLVLDRAAGNPMTGPDTGGVLYASYQTWGSYSDDCCGNDEYDGTDNSWHSGVARCLTPIVEICCGAGEDEWNYLTWGLDNDVYFSMQPQALKICGCLTADSNSKLFAIDGWTEAGYDMCEGEDGAVWTFEDCYAKKAVELISPDDGELIDSSVCERCENEPFKISWDRLCDACCYEIEFALDEDFTDLYTPWGDSGPCGDNPEIFECCNPDWICPDAPMEPSYWVEAMFLAETTYYWRLRAVEAETCQDILSWWSEARSFIIAPDTSAAAIDLVSPEPGATGVAIKNVGFSWDLLATADSFNWVLDDNADLSSPVESKTGLTSTAYGCTQTLEYSTTYFWQVTAYNEGTRISTSAVGTFTTTATGEFCCPQCGLCFDTQAELEDHIADVHPAQPATPTWVWVVIAIGAVLVIVVIVLIFRTRRV
jgi:hypothetical protein